MPNRLPTSNEITELAAYSIAGYIGSAIHCAFGALGIGLLVDLALGAWGVPASFGQCWLTAWAVYFPASLLRGPR